MTPEEKMQRENKVEGNETKGKPIERPDSPPDPNEGNRVARTQTHGGTIPKEFFNPKSMLTPGLCGGVTMLITNALAAQFDAPPNYTGS